MTLHELKADLNSVDIHRAWRAAWFIIRSADEALLRILTASIPEFEASLNKMPMPKGVYDSRLDIQLAIDTLKHFKLRNCRCKTYGSRHNPKSEAQAGFIEVEKSELKKELYEEHFYVRCLTCQKAYLVKETHGYHYPWWAWHHL